MQKHPTPTHRGSDFHWHPSGVAGSVRVALSELAARHRSPRACLWIIADNHVVWARRFPAVAPGDRRRYSGIAAVVARPATQVSEATWMMALPEVIRQLPVPAPVPFGTNGHETPDAPKSLQLTIQAPIDDQIATPVAIDPKRIAHRYDLPLLAQGIYLGGPIKCDNPFADDLHLDFADFLTWLPFHERGHPRAGLFVDEPLGHDPSSPANRGMVNLLHYLTLAWICPEMIRARRPAFPLQAWTLVLELAANLDKNLPDLLGELGSVAAAWDTADELRVFLLKTRTLTRDQVKACDARAPQALFADTVRDAGWLWTRVLHYWGRSLLPTDHVGLQRLATLLAKRIAVDHLFHLDAPERDALPHRYLRRLELETLLPQERVADMHRALTQLVPSLFRHPEVVLG